MCGIAAIYLHDSRGPYDRVDAAASALLRAIDHRGGDATGIAYRQPDGLVRCQSAPTSWGTFDSVRAPVPVGTRAVILHTRLATQGDPLLSENNHPLRHGHATVVHNGVLVNDWEVFARLEAPRMADVDSAAIPLLLDHYGAGANATASALAELEGSAAVAILDDREPGTLTLARASGSPLHVIRGKRATVAASTVDAVAAGWAALFGSAPSAKRIASMSEGTVAVLDGRGARGATFTPNPGYRVRGWDSAGWARDWDNWRAGSADVKEASALPPVSGLDVLCEWGCGYPTEPGEPECRECASAGYRV